MYGPTKKNTDCYSVIFRKEKCDVTVEYGWVGIWGGEAESLT